MPTVFRSIQRVYFDDLDALNILHNMRYLSFMERARGELLNQRGFRWEDDFSVNPDKFHVVAEHAHPVPVARARRGGAGGRADRRTPRAEQPDVRGQGQVGRRHAALRGLHDAARAAGPGDESAVPVDGSLSRGDGALSVEIDAERALSPAGRRCD